MFWEILMNKKIYWGVFCVALATLMWEILLSRIFSATMYYHFVFMSISLAMLGFGCSGVIVFLFPKYFSLEKCTSQLTLFSSLFSLSSILAIVMYLQIDVALSSSLSSFLILFKIFIFIFIPYFFSGLTITLALKHYSKNITRLYFYDLMGAGIGSALVIGLLFLYDGISLVLFVAFIAAIASVIFSQNCSKKLLRKTSLCLALLCLSAFVCNAYIYRFLKIKYVQGKPQTNIIYEKWNPINRVTVFPGDYFGHKTLEISYDSTALATLHSFDGDKEKVNFLKNYIHSFYYQIRKNAEVLIIGVGGGQDVLNAYINGHHVTGIEINPTIAQLNKEVYKDFNGKLFDQPEIQLFVDEGRNFVRHSKNTYDIIHLPNVDSGIASSSGAFTFVENTLYTVEAFKDYINHLKDDGVLWIARWKAREKGFYLEDFRILTGVVAALEEMGVKNPEQHIVMLEEEYRPDWRQMVFFFKKSPFNSFEINAIDALRKKMNLEWLHHPQQRLKNTLDDYLFSKDKQAFLDQYPVRVDPNTDNCPFFFNFLKPIHYIWKLPTKEAHNKYPVFIFKSLFVFVFFMILVTMFLPLLVFRSNLASHASKHFRWGYIFYFACLGLGFMLVEIPMIQKFILFLGQPLYAIAVILSSMLIFSGIGSFLSAKIPGKDALGKLRSAILLLCVFLTLYIYGLPQVFDAFLGASGYIRVFIAVFFTALLGLPMGMALPLGIQLIEQDGPAMIPWMWAINGACSVMGSIIAWGISLNFGYNATILTAIVIYGCALIIMMVKPSFVQQLEKS